MTALATFRRQKKECSPPSPASIGALKLLARIHLDAGQIDAARDVCRHILRRDPRDPDAGRMIENFPAGAAEVSPPPPGGSVPVCVDLP